VLIVKRKELQREIVIFQQYTVFQRNILLPLAGLFNQRTKETVSAFRRDKLKVYISDTFDRIKGTFKGFLT